MNVPNIGFVSLGCPKNLVDSERILTQLRAEGYNIVAEYEAADLVIVNTCGFIDSAVAESLDAIGEALNATGSVIVTGCLGSVRADEIKQRHPAVLAITGAHAYEEVMQLVHEYLPAPHEPWQQLIPSAGIKLTPQHYAYLKISEGCNHSCRFCVIPDMRGKLVSRPIGSVLEEAQRLVESGVRELLVVSQDTSAYGLDLKYRPDFWQGKPIETRLSSLARELGTLPAWVRLHYVYPYPHVDQLIPLMADQVILPYLDMPLQHGSADVLKRMRRPAATEKVLERLDNWRSQCPDLVLRSTFIVGFPGETDQEFEELLNFIRLARLDRVGCFAYSPVEGAAANQLPGQVEEPVKQDRLARFMQVQEEISRQKLIEKIGQNMIVLVDEVTDEAVIARGPGDAPEIDGQVLLSPEWELEQGDFVEVTVTDASEHDLFAEPID